MSKCANWGTGKATLPVQWQSVEETEIYCKECVNE